MKKLRFLFAIIICTCMIIYFQTYTVKAADNEGATITGFAREKIQETAGSDEGDSVDGDPTGDDGDEGFISNIKVQLLKKDDESIYKTTTTDEVGKYTFNNIENGTYKIRFICGQLEDSELNNSDVATIQDILKYNGQDYQLYDNDETSSFMADEERNEYLDEYFSEFNYDNTSIFSVLNDNVYMNDTFKELAKSLSENAYMIYNYENELNVSSNQEFEIPTLYLTEREGYEISTNSFVTGMQLTLSNGTVLNNLSTNIQEHQPLITPIEANQIYGTSLKLEYVVGFKNTSSYDSCSSLGFVVYLPGNFEYKEEDEMVVKGITESGEEKNLEVEEVEIIKSENIEDFEYYSNELASYVNEKHGTLLWIQLEIDNDEFEFGSGDMVKFKFYVYTLLSEGNDEMGYECKTEIVQYSNASNRRMVYTDTEIPNVVAGNNNKDEVDTQMSENSAIIILPTGSKNNKFMVIMLLISIFLGIYLIKIR